VETTQKVFTLRPDQPPDGRVAAYRMVYALGYHPAEDAILAVFGDASLKAWYASSGEPAWSLRLPAPHGWFVFSASFSADGQMVAVGMPNGPLALFDSREGRALSRQWISDAGSLMELAFSPDSQWLAAGFATGELKVWQVSRMVE
jgi:WD40 repeat protein